MCSNYEPVTRADRLLAYFGVARPEGRQSAPEVFPLGLAPFIRAREDGSGNRVVEDGVFGLLPHFAKELAYGRKTYNARSETVAKLPSFRDAWRHGQRCIVPAEAVFEPCYETGKAVRWRIQQPGAVPMGIAGIYRRWRDPEGKQHYTFAMLTVNAAGHPLYERMHRPSDEKRMVVVLDPAEYDRWLQCSVAEAITMCRRWTGPLEAQPAPLPPRGPAKPGMDMMPRPDEGGLFG